jgi:hypothetical protein
MDPAKVPFTRKRATRQQPKDAADTSSASTTNTPPTQTNQAPQAASNAPVQHQSVATTPAHSAGTAAETSAPNAHPTAAPATNTHPPSTPAQNATLTVENVEERITAAITAEDLTKLIIGIGQFVAKGLMSVQRASAMFELHYKQFVQLVQVKKTVSSDEAKTIWGIYMSERKRIEPHWQPPQKQAKT